MAPTDRSAGALYYPPATQFAQPMTAAADAKTPRFAGDFVDVSRLTVELFLRAISRTQFRR